MESKSSYIGAGPRRLSTPNRNDWIMDTPITSPADRFPLELVHLLGTARDVIDQHVNNCGNCDHCGSAWPCHDARLAEFALATL
jgi:hypothetical protein